MSVVTDQLADRQALERLLLRLGTERREIEQQLHASSQDILRVLDDAAAAEIPLSTVADLAGVSRQTLYRWRRER